MKTEHVQIVSSQGEKLYLRFKHDELSGHTNKYIIIITATLTSDREESELVLNVESVKTEQSYITVMLSCTLYRLSININSLLKL